MWRRLDPNTGRLRVPPSGRPIVVLVALIVALVVAASWSGFVVPRLVWPDNPWWARVDPGRVVAVQIEVANEGVVPATVLRAGGDGPGYEVIGNQGPTPVELGRGQSVRLVVLYRLTDCDLLRHTSFPMPVVVRRWWGEQTVDINTRQLDLISDQMCRQERPG